MKFTIVLLAFAAVAAAAPSRQHVAPLLSSEDANVVPGRYIVALKKDAPESFISHSAWLATKLASTAGNRVNHYFDMESLKGYSGEFTEEMLDEIRSNPEVEYVEQEQYYYAIDVQDSAPWGLDRIDQKALPLNGKFNYVASAGAGIDVYVIDTGINIAHVDFEGRAVWGITVPANDKDVDGNGHGTHVASTIVGKTYGVAKKATVYAVKVLSSSGSGTTADVIKGIQWTANAAKASGRKSVANMSLGGGRSTTLEAAVDAAVAAGVTFVVAAGNDNANACNYSPAAATSAITVGATTNTDAKASYSNVGTCVDIFAPGSSITAAWIGSNVALNTISGTSMASPHVAGVATLLLGENASYTPATLKAKIVSLATTGVVTGLPTNTVNKLVYIA